MSDLFVNQELQAFLVAQGVGVDPPTASLALPSVWLLPEDGPPEPRPDDLGGFIENATVTLAEQNFPPPDQGGDLEEAFVDVTVRARNEAMAKLIHRQIRGLLIDQNNVHGTKWHWTMGALLVEYSTTWRTEQTTAFTKGVCVTRIASYRFGTRRKVLAGLPYP
jgi:hypothetical protein